MTQTKLFILILSVGVIVGCGLAALAIKTDSYITKRPYNQGEFTWGIPVVGYTGLYRAKVPQDKVDKCLRWAFGEDVFVTRVKDLPDKWNQRHSGIFTMYTSEDIIKSMEKVGKAYLANK